MRVAVIGATGTAGSRIVERLAGEGVEVVGVSRSLGADVVTGRGLTEALTGVDLAIDASKVAPGNQPASLHEVVLGAARHVVEACLDRGVGRLLLLSITNIHKPAFDTFPFYVSKRAVERLLHDSPLDTSIVRSTQWFEFADTATAVMYADDHVDVADWYMQPVAVDAVADVLVREALSPTSPDVAVAGPGPVHLPDVVAGLLTVRGDGRPVRTVPPVLPGFADGSLLAPEGAEIVGPDLTTWLAHQR